jgi:hypothetical protein
MRPDVYPHRSSHLDRGRRVSALVTAAVALVVMVPGAARAQVSVFETDFESGLPPQFSAAGCVIEGVQGYSGLGRPDYQFSGNFLRYTVQAITDTRLTLTGLPPHDHLNLAFLLGVIDSWDGTELFEVLVDDNLLFSNWFQLATGDSSSYAAPPGALLSSGTNLGFTNGMYYLHDRAYDLSLEPAFQGIPHTASTANIVWRLGAVSGGAAAQWQGGSDESWALDRVAVSVTGVVGVDDDGARGFGIERLHPNPLEGQDLVVRFTLAGERTARLELFNVAGRRVAERAVTGAGPHQVTLSPRGELPSGIYLVRLSQGANVQVRRAVVLDSGRAR